MTGEQPGGPGGPVPARVRAAAQSAQGLRLLADHIPDLLFRFELRPERRFTYVSPAATALTGFRPEELYEHPEIAAALLHPEDRATLVHAVTDPARLRHGINVRWLRRDDSQIWCELRGRAETGPDGLLVAIEGVIRDVTDQVRQRQRLEYESHDDPVTGLGNRRMVEEVLAEGIERAAPGDGLAVICTELDRFGLVVDAMGQEAAEHLLRAAADRLLDLGEPGASVACSSSWGFTITAPVPDARTAEALVGRIRRALSAPLRALGREVHVTCSVGVRVYFGEEPVTPDGLVRDADGARRAGAIETGLGSVRVYDRELHGRIAARLALEADMRRALDDEAFEVAYQPQLDLATGRPVGLEALARWRNGDEHVPPAVFIPIAEETGLIVELGHHILRSVAADVARWRAEGHLRDERVSVNLSGRQLAAGAIDDLVLSVLAEHDLPTSALTLEITESTVMTAEPGGLEALGRLHASGVCISVDDFGTGYSSLATLKALRLGEVKIDRGFVSGVADDPDDAAICAAVLGLASSLGLGVVAEGVEEIGQARRLLSMGCSVAQGYLYSRPVPASDVAATLAALRDTPLVVGDLPPD